MEVPQKGGYGIVNDNPRRTYCPLVPKRDTFYVTDDSPQVDTCMQHNEFLSLWKKY